MKNQEVIRIFREMAIILELKGENPFRIRAYERAAQSIENLDQDLENLIKEDKLTTITGIGRDLADKIKEIFSTGALQKYEQLKKEFPAGVLDMLAIPGLGPKTVKLIYAKLKIDSIAKLEQAAKKGQLRVLEGVKEKTEENILRGIELIRKGSERVPIAAALAVAADFLGELKKLKEVEKIETAGSLRRRKETIKDIDILVSSNRPQTVMDKFVALPPVKEILAHGATKSSVISQNMQVDLRVVEDRSFGAALMYFTGAKEFNVKLRQLAINAGYKLNEYGLFSKDEKFLAGRTEEEIFSLLKMEYIPPVLREDRGEIKAALAGKLPKLVMLGDIRGDFHVHSQYSDGVSSIEEIVQKAQSLGYEYVAVTDHSQSLKVAKGLPPQTLRKKIEEIKKLNKKVKKIKILAGAEVDISSAGSLDYPPDLLKELDIVIAAIHSGFKQPKEQLTKRIVTACKNKYVNIIAHPTGRLWGVREPYEIDFEQVFSAAADYNVAIEINCHHQRLDLNDLGAMKAKKKGVKLAIGSDAHVFDNLDTMRLGIDVAQRGWLEKKDIINCMTWEKLIKWLKK